MRIGVDLDNTIVCYDGLFHTAAREAGLIPSELLPHKRAVRAWIQAKHGNEAWTCLQGSVYGPLMHRADPFPRVREFLTRCRGLGIAVCILSHKTRHAAAGDPFDLQEAARQWLARHRYFGLEAGDVEFHETRAEKIAAIARRGCEVFIDDLPEVFADKAFPTDTSPLLFDPEGNHNAMTGIKIARSWGEIEELLLTPRVVG